MKQYYKLTIVETGRDSLKDEPYLFNEETLYRRTLEGIKAALHDRYGKIPRKMKDNTIYDDSVDGEAIPVGFTYSYWNKDWSHNSKSWYQTDWVQIAYVIESPVLLTS